MTDFERLLAECRGSAVRFIRYRLPEGADWESVYQEVCLSAYLHFDKLEAEEKFKPWLLAIAQNKCRDWYRKRSNGEVPREQLPLRPSPCGRRESPVADTLAALKPGDRQLLTLYYLRQLSQQEIARAARLPLGTVKSRLHRAKAAFRKAYPYPPKEKTDNAKGECTMTKLPGRMPAYTLTPIKEPPFPITWEELPGMLIVPKAGESLCWGMYDEPDGLLTGQYRLKATGKAVLHGVEGVEVQGEYREGDTVKHSVYIAQLTQRHCRYLGERYVDKEGITRYLTFLDGEEFLQEWGIGKDNCGRETRLVPRGAVTLEGENALLCREEGDVTDAAGRFRVEIAGKSYDTVLAVTLCAYPFDGTLVLQYLDGKGRTVLWQRYNRDDWGVDRGGEPWTKRLPLSRRVTVNGETYVHWYDCITDYVL